MVITGIQCVKDICTYNRTTASFGSTEICICDKTPGGRLCRKILYSLKCITQVCMGLFVFVCKYTLV
jgi:hypothetical protein